MKIALLGLALLAGIPALAQTNTPAHPSPCNFPGVKFPQIEADSRVTFQFKAPNAQKVQVSILDHPFDMVKGGNGVWAYTTSEPQAPGYHNYWMIVDGAVVLDPGTQAYIGYGHMCNGFEVPDPDGDFYALKDVPHGNVLIKNYFAKTDNSWRHIYVYTPPDYEKNRSKHYPVLYLQHGGGEDQRVWTEMGHANLILDNLIAAGKAKPMIIVMETSAVTPASPLSGLGGPYGQLMVNDLIPWVDSNFRTLTDKNQRAMAGLSMGGMQTRTVTMAHLDKFSYIGLFSSGGISTNSIHDLAAFKRSVKLVFISCGSIELGSSGAPGGGARGGSRGGPGMGDPKLAVAALQTEGINSHYYISPLTAHEWQTWRRSLREFAPLLFQK